MESVKWLGACFASVACLALGFGLGATLGSRAKALGEMERGLRSLSLRVTQLYEPMEEALGMLSMGNPIFLQVLEHMEDGPQAAWEAALGTLRGLTSSDRAQIVSMMVSSATAGRDEQERIFSVGLTQLGQTAQEAAAKAATDAKLYRTLGILAAVALIVLSI